MQSNEKSLPARYIDNMYLMIINWVYMVNDPFPRQNLVMDRVVREGNIITAQGNAFVDFAIEVAD